jgi:hypothetical protein
MRHWARENAPNLSLETVRKETEIFKLKARTAGKVSFDWFAEWCIFIIRKADWMSKEGTSTNQPELPLEGATASSSNLKPPLPNCPHCFGSGQQVVQGKGARRCPCRTRQDDDEAEK